MSPATHPTVTRCVTMLSSSRTVSSPFSCIQNVSREIEAEVINKRGPGAWMTRAYRLPPCHAVVILQKPKSQSAADLQPQRRRCAEAEAEQQHKEKESMLQEAVALHTLTSTSMNSVMLFDFNTFRCLCTVPVDRRARQVRSRATKAQRAGRGQQTKHSC